MLCKDFLLILLSKKQRVGATFVSQVLFTQICVDQIRETQESIVCTTGLHFDLVLAYLWPSVGVPIDIVLLHLWPSVNSSDTSILRSFIQFFYFSSIFKITSRHLQQKSRFHSKYGKELVFSGHSSLMICQQTI